MGGAHGGGGGGGGATRSLGQSWWPIKTSVVKNRMHLEVLHHNRYDFQSPLYI